MWQDKDKNGGWTNLLKHLCSCMGEDFGSVFDNARKECAKNHNTNCGLGGLVLCLSNTEKELFQWIKLIVMKNLLLGFIDCPYFCNMLSKLKPARVSQHITTACDCTLKGYEGKDQGKASSKFVVVFDGWTEGTEHLILAVSAW